VLVPPTRQDPAFSGQEPAGPPEAGQQEPQRIPRWLERSELFLRVLLRMYIGLAVAVAPWWPMFWDNKPLYLRWRARAA
jgi:hypothetical protein